MRAPGFWTAPEPTLPARLLWPLGAIVGTIGARRMRKPGARAALPVICIGNFTAGGAGKTPTALALAALLRRAGRSPVFLTRGHGGRARTPLLVDAAIHDHRAVGDEPLLLARAGPTIVSPDRVAGAALAATTGADVILMDDGLQNPSLKKDLVLAVLDGETGVGNGLCLPAGPLRVPLEAQWPFVDALVLMGYGAAGARVAAEAARRGKPVFRARLAPDPSVLDRLDGARVLAFAGIGRPEKFFRTLEDCGASLIERVALPDHHVYRPGEVQALMAHATARGLVPVTTEKDAARLPALEGLLALPVTARFEDEAGLAALAAERIARP
ncbi:tetraacyldisaccharide 4'-kinase [Salinarimonas ramus]|uniref:Tetraacyldisaccharide 4'-kinase n=1 Tax=Salinarimonas ramus TaxID=690164 RepID=A0A917Q781_9HYPH|nr:tetraacyldisaccharide 4'-kinase [Salinarimonas ramus]GGK30719.1 tetraacyldisaccharide 4'-kinase [Salinarimonas ramus]